MENKNDMAIEINQLISTLAVDGDVVLKNQIRVTNKAKQVIEEDDEQVVNELKNQIANLSMVILNKKEHMKNLLARLNDMIDKM
jgi:F420-0:gamma-glutamyl ligase-like protein